MSSARAEALGLLGIVVHEGPIHAGIDNVAVVKRANKLLRSKGTRLPQPRRHWGLQADGDVWHAIHHAIDCKSKRSVRVSKVKGHATADHVAAGIVKLEDKAGNDVADDGVGKARGIQDCWREHVMDALGSR